jgi:PP-loop superfamily ATP-utilizing enzyme
MNQTFIKDAENTKNHSLAKVAKTQKFSDEISKDAKKYETQITRIPIHRRRPKKILKKMEKMQQV